MTFQASITNGRFNIISRSLSISVLSIVGKITSPLNCGRISIPVKHGTRVSSYKVTKRVTLITHRDQTFFLRRREKFCKNSDSFFLFSFFQQEKHRLRQLFKRGTRGGVYRGWPRLILRIEKLSRNYFLSGFCAMNKFIEKNTAKFPYPVQYLHIEVSWFKEEFLISLVRLLFL